jgi:hypothetical protein
LALVAHTYAANVIFSEFSKGFGSAVIQSFSSASELPNATLQVCGNLAELKTLSINFSPFFEKFFFHYVFYELFPEKSKNQG